MAVKATRPRPGRGLDPLAFRTFLTQSCRVAFISTGGCMMDRVASTSLLLAFTAALIHPAFGQQSLGQDKFEVPLGTPAGQSASSPKLSLGSVGLDSRAGGSYVPSPGSGSYYFLIPGERPFQKVPGVLLRIPLGRDIAHQ